MKAQNIIKLLEDKKDHKLIIKSLDDGQAECSAGDWSYSRTGPVSKEEIQKEFKKHLSGLKEGVVIIASHDDHPASMVAQRIIKFIEQDQDDVMVQLLYPERRKVSASKIIMWAKDAYADGDIDHEPENIEDAIEMLQDAGIITVSKKWWEDRNELYNGPSWGASHPGMAGPGPVTQTIPEKGKENITLDLEWKPKLGKLGLRFASDQKQIDLMHQLTKEAGLPSPKGGGTLYVKKGEEYEKLMDVAREHDIYLGMGDK